MPPDPLSRSHRASSCPAADVVKVGPQIGKTDAHVEMQWRLAGGLHETHAMVSRAGMDAAMDAKIRFRV
jgi:hypothetical protein